MNKRKYSYVMMDANQFEWYQRHCKRNNLPCNYNQISPDCYGVMIGEERKENNIEYVERVEKEIIN